MYKDSEAIMVLKKNQVSAILKELNLDQRHILRTVGKDTNNYDGNYDSLLNNEFTKGNMRIWIDRNSDRTNNPFCNTPDALYDISDNYSNNGGDIQPEYYWLRTCVQPGVYGSESTIEGIDESDFDLGMSYSLFGYVDEDADGETIDVNPDPEIFTFSEDECRVIIAMSLENDILEYFEENISDELEEFIDKHRIFRFRNDDGAELWVLANMIMQQDEDEDEISWRSVINLFDEAYSECSGNSVLHAFPQLGPVSDWHGIGGKFVPWNGVYDFCYEDIDDTSIIYGNVYEEDTPFQLGLQRYIRVKDEPERKID